MSNGGLFFFSHLDGTVAWKERTLRGLFLKLFYLVTVQLQHSHGIIAVPLSQLCLSPLLGKDDGSRFPACLQVHEMPKQVFSTYH